MQKYICPDCGELFDEPAVYREKHGMEGPYYEEFSVCPACGEAYEEAVPCTTCGKAIPKSYARDRFSLCQGCETKAHQAFQAYMEEFTPDERRYLNWLYESEEF